MKPLGARGVKKAIWRLRARIFSFSIKCSLILGAVGIRCIGLCRTHARETRGMNDGFDLITSSFSALVY